MKLARTAFLIVAATVMGAALVHAHGGSHGQLTGPVTQEERAAFAAARPVFEQHCFRCHTAKGRKARPKSLAHLTMDRYPFGGHHASEAAAVIRGVLGAGPEKKEASMPSDDRGAVTGDQLAKVLAWADAFDRAHLVKKAPASSGDQHH
jgi:hypothetical protein